MLEAVTPSRLESASSAISPSSEIRHLVEILGLTEVLRLVDEPA
jgi:hypothetical protein